MEMPALQEFSLVGGTALSLRYGHRTSIDLDLFSMEKFSNDAVVAALHEEFGHEFSYESSANSHFGIFCFIEGVKVDLVRFPHPMLLPIVVTSGIRMYSSEDIAAMKIQAILGRGRKKDFWDLVELFKHFSLGQIIDLQREKYPNQMLAIGIPNAITYYVDAEDSEEPVSLRGQTWEDIKRSVSRTVSDFLR
jgi:predicted nucleotidyltransferase component of viral defense system